MEGIVKSVSVSPTHSFNKLIRSRITLIKGIGVDGDAHAGETVKHRSRVARDPSQPNLRQVHLIQQELHEELRAVGFKISAGDLGENITTQGLNLLDLSKGTRLRIGASAVVEVMGLRDPCSQLNEFQTGLMAAVLDRDAEGNLIRKAGIMGIVLVGGVVQVGDSIVCEIPPGSHIPLKVV